MKERLRFLFATCMACAISCCAQSEPPMPAKDHDISQFEVKGGHHQPFRLGSTAAPYGYFLFTPESYQTSKDKLPLLIFLHGYGERGNSQEESSDLDKILKHGPPKMIENSIWAPTNKMVVASPQCHGNWWNRDKLKEFIEYLVKEYNVDQKRVYLTGLSMGGYATFDLLGTFGDELNIAAAVPIWGSGELNEANNLNISKTPVWVFHGSADTTVKPEYSMKIVPAVNALAPKVPAKLTVYPGVGHNSWTMTYSGSGMGKEDSAYDAFDQNIYDWMYQFTR